MSAVLPVSLFVGRLARGWLCGLSLLLATWAGPAWSAPPGAAEYTRKASFDTAVLSPSGDRLAMLLIGPEGRLRLAVMELKPRQKPRMVAAYANADIESVHWVNDQRLAYHVVAWDDGVAVPAGMAGVFAVNADGSDVRQLIAWRLSNDSTGTGIQSRVLTYEWRLHRTLDDGSDDVLVSRALRDVVDDITASQLARLNTRTGQFTNLGQGAPVNAQHWLTDAKGEPVVVTAVQGGRTRTHWRAGSDQPWTLIQDEDSLAGQLFQPLLVEPNGRLIVRARRGRDTAALYTYELAQRRLVPEPLAALDGFDLHGSVDFDSQTQTALGLHFRTERPVTVWFDEGMQRLQAMLDAALPAGRYNQIGCGRCLRSSHLVVESHSDRHPGEFYLFDRAERKLELLGRKRPSLPEDSQGRRSFHRLKARDGLELPVYVTHPRGAQAKEPLPAVLLVHGGPWVRGGDLGWDAEPQFLASLGYRVIEPEFRGSEGYGYRLFSAGKKQWGHAMQDDLADTVAWAAEQGLVDPRRVCIMGASYGGYAALMSPIRYPDTYRCAIAFAALTDMALRYTAWGSDLSEEGKRHVLPQLMADPDKDAALLRESSPLLRVAEIKIPVLLAHGAYDRRLPVEHADRFVRAARAAKVNVQYQLYLKQGHGWVLPDDQTDFYQRVQRFLAEHLQPTSKQP